MIYYAVVYTKNGEIYLKPFNSKEEAVSFVYGLKMREKWAAIFDKAKIVKKDTSTDLWKKMNGYWIR